MFKIVLLRHGQSKWNLENRFTGWTDINLTKKGISEAQLSGKILKKNGFQFDLVYTSLLERAISTMEICIDEMEIKEIKKIHNWRLNERHYGALQGLNKKDTAKKYGDEQILIWRRSYNIRPPELEYNDKRHPRFNQKFSDIDISLIPSSECLKDTFNRFLPLWKNNIIPKILSGHKILIVAHGNSLRALVKYLDKISDDEIVNLNIPTGIPLIYELGKDLEPIKNYYLKD